MGKSGKKSKAFQRQRGVPRGDGSDVLPSSAYDLSGDQQERGDGADGEAEGEDSNGGGGADVVENETSVGALSKFDLYQQSVQRPKGDISYLQKFFLIYVGGRRPLYLQEDFCGTGFLSSEWLHSDPRRTAVGLDLDLEALYWCLENNISKIGCDGYPRISLFHGNVLHPHKAHLVKPKVHDPIGVVDLRFQKDFIESSQSTIGAASNVQACSTMEEASLPPRDIICAFNYSCCCLQQREDLVRYFKHALSALSKMGGIFVMDLYGGISSERKLRLQRKFPNFTYIWEQGEFDIISRRTRISLHFHLGKRWKFRHAFSYDWRLWTLPEIKDCLQEAGFQSIHFWIRKMPNIDEGEHWEEPDAKYEESSSFMQQDAWNAYAVAVANL
ncbi:uncharacterized protein LOC110030116 [Phalaenopsis equestris]|uniref:uncharacterized protein LOC110030116 n=1 Tax=Phalaenopsis equestris TaxID=78828 RepID=UPI0009E4B4E2|nr:uncharacterized protein LOC110030116 [Phalaenopsis equestris]